MLCQDPVDTPRRKIEFFVERAMSHSQHLEPGPDHPITISSNPNRVVVKVSGKTLVDTKRALMLKESSYPEVFYVPREDADMSLLERTDHHTYCPYKGDCSYYRVRADNGRAVNAVWTYETPYPAVSEIAGHLAFYPDRVDSIEEVPNA